MFQFQQPLFHLPFSIRLGFKSVKSDLTDVSGTTKNIGNDTEITQIELRMAPDGAYEVSYQSNFGWQIHA
jgi:hypothetical protein